MSLEFRVETVYRRRYPAAPVGVAGLDAEGLPLPEVPAGPAAHAVPRQHSRMTPR
jgi:hypothetical protein